MILGAQPIASDQKASKALVKEMQQLRRAMLLIAHVQLAVGDLQVQEAAVARLAQQHNEVRSGGATMSVRRKQLTDRVQDLEMRRTNADASSRGVLDVQLIAARSELVEVTAADEERSSRETDVASELNAARSALSDTRARIAELQRSLNAAIQELPKKE
jgi:hypothetical protein